MNGENDFVIEDGTLKKYSGNSSEVAIPSEVTEIDYCAFEKCSELKSLIRVFYGSHLPEEIKVDESPISTKTTFLCKRYC